MQWFGLNKVLCLKTWRTFILVQRSNARQPISAENGSKQTGSDPFEPRLAFEGKRPISWSYVCSKRDQWNSLFTIFFFICQTHYINDMCLCFGWTVLRIDTRGSMSAFNLHGLECAYRNWGKVRVLINRFVCIYVIWVCSKVTRCAYLVG